jgi:hypothetical protein
MGWEKGDLAGAAPFLYGLNVKSDVEAKYGRQIRHGRGSKDPVKLWRKTVETYFWTSNGARELVFGHVDLKRTSSGP